jgi:hypothetical protein
MSIHNLIEYIFVITSLIILEGTQFVDCRENICFCQKKIPSEKCPDYFYTNRNSQNGVLETKFTCSALYLYSLYFLLK